MALHRLKNNALWLLPIASHAAAAAAAAVVVVVLLWGMPCASCFMQLHAFQFSVLMQCLTESISRELLLLLSGNAFQFSGLSECLVLFSFQRFMRLFLSWYQKVFQGIQILAAFVCDPCGTPSSKLQLAQQLSDAFVLLGAVRQCFSVLRARAVVLHAMPGKTTWFWELGIFGPCISFS